MIDVSSYTIASLKSDSCTKLLAVTVGSTSFNEMSIYKDSIRLTETVLDGRIEFVGCIASIFEFKVSTSALAVGDYKGQTVTAVLTVDYREQIPLFNGVVDSCEKSADGLYQSFVCYDKLAYFSETAGYNVYKAAFTSTSITLGTFKNNVLNAIGLTASTQTLANDNIIFRKRKRNKDVTVLNLIRQIAQIYGGFGIINRDGEFEVRFIDDGATPDEIPYYRSFTYSDNVIQPIGSSSIGDGSVTIRTNSQDAGVTVDWSNYSTYAGTDPGWSDETQDTYLIDDDDSDIVLDSYVIENNLISYKLSKAKKRVIAANIMASIGNDAAFREYELKCNGLPYLECCDKILVETANGTRKELIITKRVLEGLQNMTDTYTCTLDNTDTTTYVSNVDTSTQSTSSSFNEALDLTSISITENGTYAANDSGAEGFRDVTVNVSSGGVAPSGRQVQAIALEDISAGDAVYIQDTSTGGEAPEVNTYLTGKDLWLAYDNNDTVYIIENSTCYTLPYSNLNGTPASAAGSYPSPFRAFRNMLGYTSSSTDYIKNLETGATATLARSAFFAYASKDFFRYGSNMSTPPHYRISDMRSTGNDYPYREYYSLTEGVGLESDRYSYGTSSHSDTYYFADTSIDANTNRAYWNTDGERIFFCNTRANSNGKYDVGYTNFGENSFNVLGESATQDSRMFWDSAGERLCISLGVDGLMIVYPNLTCAVFSNITNASAGSTLFGDYIYMPQLRKVFRIAQNTYMGKTTSKNMTGSLGCALTSVSADATGTAVVMFT